jgi:hypothetical protein
MNRVIVKIRFKTLELLAHFERYIEYYNRFLASRNNNDFYLEVLQDGVIIIYKSIDVYCKRCSPLSVEEQEKIRAISLTKDPFLLKLIIPRSSFPQDGIHFYYSIVLGEPAIMYPRGIEFFKSISPTIEVKSISEKEGEIILPVYDGIVDYLKTMAWKYLLPK